MAARTKDEVRNTAVAAVKLYDEKQDATMFDELAEMARASAANSSDPAAVEAICDRIDGRSDVEGQSPVVHRTREDLEKLVDLFGGRVKLPSSGRNL